MSPEPPIPQSKKKLLHARPVWELWYETYKAWQEHNAPTLGAALAFYATFSMAPLLIVVIAVFGVILGKETIQMEILTWAQALIGVQGADAIKMMLAAAYRPGTGLPATIIGVLVVLIGSTSALVMLKQALNIMWGARPDPNAPVWNLVKGRLLSFAMVLVIGLLLLLSLLLSIGVSCLTGFLRHLVPVPILLIQISYLCFSFILITALFAVIFKVLPDVDIAWSDVWIGAAITAVLFTLGKSLFGMYLARSTISSAYGAASSLAIILLWVYYSAQVFFIGAEFTQVYANRYGSRVKPRN